jgi:hypothetical protein
VGDSVLVDRWWSSCTRPYPFLRAAELRSHDADGAPNDRDLQPWQRLHNILWEVSPGLRAVRFRLADGLPVGEPAGAFALATVASSVAAVGPAPATADRVRPRRWARFGAPAPRNWRHFP